MEADPTNADQPKRKRRWFQFSLRTLLVGVTVSALLCGEAACLLGDLPRLLQERESLLNEAVKSKLAAEAAANEARLMLRVERQMREVAQKRADAAEEFLRRLTVDQSRRTTDSAVPAH
jgi:hypothetical protein